MPSVYVYSKKEIPLTKPEDSEVVFFTNFNTLKDIEKEDIFVSYEHDTPLAFRLQEYQLPRENLAVVTKEKNLVQVLDLEEYNYNEDYDIFYGTKINSIEKKTKIIILESLKLMVDIMYQMLDAGYLENKSTQKIEDWILSFEHPVLKIFKIYHQLETSNDSIDVEEEFLINPQFRHMILIMIMKIMANFIINNEMITAKEVSKIGDWNSKETWIDMRKQVKLLKKSEK